jgi:hypothetical protein
MALYVQINAINREIVMKHFRYRVVAAPNWHISDAEWEAKMASDIIFWYKDFREAEACAKMIAKNLGLDMEILSKPYGQPQYIVYTVKPFMKGRLIK